MSNLREIACDGCDNIDDDKCECVDCRSCGRPTKYDNLNGHGICDTCDDQQMIGGIR